MSKHCVASGQDALYQGSSLCLLADCGQPRTFPCPLYSPTPHRPPPQVPSRDRRDFSWELGWARQRAPLNSTLRGEEIPTGLV